MARNNNKWPAIALLVATTLLLVAFALALSFVQQPSITPANPKTAENLTCSWQSSPDTIEANVTWLKNGVFFLAETATANSSKIPHQNTSKNDIWNCTVSLFNGTDTLNGTASIRVSNSAPDEPNVYNSSGQDIGSAYTLREDSSYSFDINGTDPDNDSLEYYVIPANSFCSVDDAVEGLITCSPTSINLAANFSAGYTNITFWATDSDPLDPFSGGQKVLFTIQPVNDRPSFNPALVNRTIYEGQRFNYVITGADEESNFPLNFSITSTPSLSLNITNISNTTAVAMLDQNRTATYSESGNYTVTIQMTDSQGAERNASFNLEIRQTNIAPVIRDIPTYNGTQGSSFSFAIYADDADENNTLNFSLEAICPPSIQNPWTINTTNTSRNATANVSVTVLNNSHVACRNVRIIVSDDNGAEDSKDVFLNISNTNDPPIVEVLSFFNNNSYGLSDMRALYAYASSEFTYAVNATDVDTLTYEGDTLAYSENSTLFAINASTGLINFVPLQADVGEHIINITATDSDGLTHSRVMNLTIRGNSAPVLEAINNITCPEDLLCRITFNGSDADNDNMTFTSNSSIFAVINNASQNPVASAFVNFTPLQSQIGNYSILVTATDSRGASVTDEFIFTINNTNDAPALQAFNFPQIVETHTVILTLDALDEDYLLPNSYESITFEGENLTGKSLFTPITIANNATNRTNGQIVFTPQIGDAGNYSVLITARDAYNMTSTIVKNFTVLPKGLAPNITHISPFGAPYSSITNLSSTATSNYATRSTNVATAENTSITYSMTVTDESPATLTYEWIIDGSLLATSASYTANYGFFSSGIHNITAIVSDNMYENTSWTWMMQVNNVNRPPRLANNLENLTVNQTETFSSFLKNSPVTHFIDPDDDLNSNGQFDNGETSNLTYTHDTCTAATLTVNSHSLTVRPIQVGSCLVTFDALDEFNATAASNRIRINLSNVPNETVEVEVPQPDSGGGGGGRSASVVIPIRKEDIKPQAITLIVPELVTIYKNRSVLVPVQIQNTWNSTLSKVTLNATTTSEEDIQFMFSRDYFEELRVGEKHNVSLLISNYRMGSDYKIMLTANVTKPKTHDEAFVMLNTIEQAENGNDVETKVTFAQDLLNENPECLELNELLEKAKEELSKGEEQGALNIVNGVIDGCKYLVSISKKTTQKPETIVDKVTKKENLKYLIIFGALAVFITVTLLLVRHGRLQKRKQKDEQAKQGKEETFKPYWPGKTE